MRKFRLDNLIKIFLLIFFIAILAVYSGKAGKADFGQAQRIAEWKSIYEELSYCFDLVNLYEGSIIPDTDISESALKQRIMPYFNIDDKSKINLKKYKYRKRNRTKVRKDYPYYFNDFFITKTGTLLSVKKAEILDENNYSPEFFMFVDINGTQGPNRIGKDIFFLNLYPDNITPAGYGADRAQLKTNCSPVASGVYCSQYYLSGGRF